MKGRKAVSILIIIATLSFAQEPSLVVHDNMMMSDSVKSQEPVKNNQRNPQYYEARIQRFKKLKTGGIVLLVTGAAASGIGIGMIASAGTSVYQVNYTNGDKQESGDPVGGFGGVLVSGGIPMVITGIVLTAVAGKKIHQYKRMSNDNSGVDIKAGINRIQITYDF